MTTIAEIPNMSLVITPRPNPEDFKLALGSGNSQPVLISDDIATYRAHLKTLIEDPATEAMFVRGLSIHRFLFSSSCILFDNGEKVYFSSDSEPFKEIRKLFDLSIDPKGKNPIQWTQRHESGLRGLSLSGPHVPTFTQGYIHTPFTEKHRETAHATFSAADQAKAQARQTAFVDFYKTLMDQLEREKTAAPNAKEQKEVQKKIDKLAQVNKNMIEEVLAYPFASNDFDDMKEAQKTFKESLLARLPVDRNKLFHNTLNRTLDVTDELEKDAKILAVRMALARVADRKKYGELLRQFSDYLKFDIPETSDSIEEAFINLAVATSEGTADEYRRFFNETRKLLGIS